MATNGDRLTGLDSSFLRLESPSAHMHVAGVMLFDGSPPEHQELVDAISGRLHLVPRYRQKLAFVPFGQGRPRWVDDPHLNLHYHVRSTALPAPGSEAQLKALAGRVFSQRLDRDKPLWELWVGVALSDVKAIKDSLGGTVNDVMLAIVAGALGRDLRRRGVDVRGLELKTMVPVSVRSQEARGALGNQVAAMMAPLPVGCDDPVDRFELISAELRKLKESGQAVGARVMTDLTGFAPPNIMSQAARVVARQRFFNVVVTNVPGPQTPLYLMGRKLVETFPMVPLLDRQALGVAILSYDGRINFGLVGDYDVMADLDQLARDFRASLLELAEAAGVELTVSEEIRTRSRNGHRPGGQVGAPEAAPAPEA